MKYHTYNRRDRHSHRRNHMSRLRCLVVVDSRQAKDPKKIRLKAVVRMKVDKIHNHQTMAVEDLEADPVEKLKAVLVDNFDKME